MIELDSAIANRNQLQNFIASSEPVLKKVVESFALDQ